MPRGSLQTILQSSPLGVREDVSPAFIEDGYLLSSANWLSRQGRGRPRPGQGNLTTVTDTGRIIGIHFRGTKDQAANLIFNTLAHQYSYDGTSISDATNPAWVASSSDELVRGVSFTQGGQLYLLEVNDSNALMEWTGTGTFTSTSGSPPQARDIMVLGNRVVLMNISGGTYPTRVQWSGFKDRTVWSSIAFADLSESPGAVVGGAPFSPNSGAIYKDDSIYLATVQAAVEPFQFQFVSMVPGPLSAAALVNVLGVHYWLAQDFSIYKFDGAEPKLVSSGLAKTISDNINYSDKGTCHGFPHVTQDFREVWFFYPNRTDGFNAISCNIITGAINHHTFANTITASSSWRLGGATIDGLDAFSSTIDGLDSYSTTINGLDGGTRIEAVALVGTNVGLVNILGSAYTQDISTAIAWSFEHPWTAPGKDQARVQADAVDTLWLLTGSPLTVTVGLTVTDKLTDSETPTTATFNVGTDSQHLLTFPNLRGKLVKVKHSAASVVSGLEYRGGIMTSWPRGRV